MTHFPRDFPTAWLAFAAAAILPIAWNGSAIAQDQPPMPGPVAEHEILKREVGTWDAAMTFWMMPGAEPVTSKGTETDELLPGGMWLVSRFEGDVAGMPFTGVGTVGYDPVEKKYVGTWVDTMSPHMMTSRGDYDPATKTMTSIAEVRSPETGQMVTFKQIGRSIDNATRSFEMHMQGEDGQYWKMMEIQYRRRSK